MPLFSFYVFVFKLYVDLPIVLTIVRCDGTSILSLHNMHLNGAGLLLPGHAGID